MSPGLIFSALVAGLVHSFGPDHLVTVTTLVANRSRSDRAGTIGALWGAGHGLGVLLLGATAIVAGSVWRIEIASAFAEKTVGVILLFLGARALYPLLRGRLHAHAHDHDGHTHAHFHRHPGAEQIHDHGHAESVGIGVIHGLAGSAHVLGILPAMLLPAGAALAYLLLFATGTMAGMAATALLWSHLLRTPRAATHERRMRLSTAAAALALGAYWLAVG